MDQGIQLIRSNKYEERIQTIDNNINNFSTQLAQTDEQIIKFDKHLNGEISILQFGADDTGYTLSTNAFKAVAEYARQLAISTNFVENVVVILNGGTYSIDERIIFSPFVKVKTRGFVQILTRVAGDSIFHFTGQEGDPDFKNIMNKQQFQRGKYVDASDGGILFKSLLQNKETNSTTAIEIGSRTNIGELLPTSRYSLSDIAVEGYTLALKMNKFNNYLGTFDRLHLEGNVVNVQFGDSVGNVVNSGENFSFNNCVFAGADKAIEWRLDGMDCNFYGCSFDFNKIVFNLRRGWKKIGVFGGHIEGTSDKVVKFVEEGFSGYQPQVHLDNVVMYNDYKGVLFSGPFYLSDNNCRWERVSRQEVLYACTSDVRVQSMSMRVQGIPTILSEYNCKLSNGKFQRVNTSSGDVSTPIPNFTIAKSWYAIPIVTSQDLPPGATNTKALKIVAQATEDDLSWLTQTTDKIPCQPMQTLECGISMYQVCDETATVRNFTFAFIFYDEEGNTISTTSNYSDHVQSESRNVWRVVMNGTKPTAPIGTRSAACRLTISKHKVGEEVYIEEFYFGVI